MLKRDRRWELFYGDISLEQFVDKKLPTPVFKKAVNKDIVDSFAIAYQLLIHSYYQYLFVDIAVARALHIFEMALGIRYKELNGKEWDLKNKRLNQLIDWFNERSYFEIADKSFLSHVRSARNEMTHLKGFNFAGSASLHWINTVVDLINGLYDDIELRKERWRSTSDNKSKLDLFLTHGAKLTFLDNIYHIYDSGTFKIENRIEPHLCYFSLLPIFEVDNAAPKIPLVFSYPINALDFKGPIVELSLGAGRITLSNELTQDEKSLIEKFRIKVKDEKQHSIHHSMLIFDASNTISRELSESLSNKIMEEQEFTFVIKHNISLETGRNNPPS